LQKQDLVRCRVGCGNIWNNILKPENERAYLYILTAHFIFEAYPLSAFLVPPDKDFSLFPEDIAIYIAFQRYAYILGTCWICLRNLFVLHIYYISAIL
jgi:hypothetical protein